MGTPTSPLHRLPLLLAVLALLLVACTEATPTATPTTPAQVARATGEPTLQPDDLVDLTLYLRAGEGTSAHLLPVTREVPVGQDLPLRAMELLVAGPVEGENGLHGPLPSTVQVVDLEVEGGTARLGLSPEAVRDASTVGSTAVNEALALGAIANTLTEFPSIERVALTVNGQGIGEGEFWGTWGLPEVLIRDESLVGPAPEDGEGLLDVGRFSDESQSVGSDRASGVEVTAVRTRDRLTHVRIIVEIADTEGAASIPRARARRSGDEITLDLAGVDRYSAELGAGGPLELSDPSFRELSVEERDGGLLLLLEVDEARERTFWLHALSSPTRVVLDVRK